MTLSIKSRNLFIYFCEILDYAGMGSGEILNLAHRAFAALRAMLFRRSGVNDFALAAPPSFPMSDDVRAFFLFMRGSKY